MNEDDRNPLVKGPASELPSQIASTFLTDPERGAFQDSSPLSAALEASLRLAASLLAQCHDLDVPEGPVIDIDLGGYHWTVIRSQLAPPDLDLRLSPREREIVRMVALGLTNRAMASALEISPWTVSTYLRRVFGKLQVSSRAAMVARVVELGLDSGMDGLQRDSSA